MIALPAPALRYYGGKFRLASWIISHFPEHTTYVEPFGGAASILLQKPPSYLEIYNDLDRSVVTFFKVLRERPDDLVRVIGLTPYSRVEYQLACTDTEDELELARRTYVRCWQGFGAKQIHSGWRFQPTRSRGMPMKADWGRYENLFLIASRLREVQIEHDDALKVIERYDTSETLFYVDPPYVHKTRGQTRCYLFEMSDEEHESLANVLRSVKGMVILSGYETDLYDKLYSGWHKTAHRTRNNRRKSILEFLWISPNAQKHILRLF